MSDDNEGRWRVRDLNEIELVERVTQSLKMEKSVVKGPGDDCAVVELDDTHYALLKTDCIVEGIHFAKNTDSVLVGRKALARVLSDIAAMGGEPLHALVTLMVSHDREVAEIEEWYQGMEALAREYSVSIVGGETSSLEKKGTILSIALTGRVEKDKCVYRGRAKKGDLIAVTGRLGGSFKSGRHLRFQPRIAEARWLCQGEGKPTSMMDLSDGLAVDLPRLLEGTNCGYRIDREALLVHEDASLESAIGEGEDYELLMTLPDKDTESLINGWQAEFPGTPLTVIGEVVAETEDPLEGGWMHF